MLSRSCCVIGPKRGSCDDRSGEVVATCDERVHISTSSRGPRGLGNGVWSSALKRIEVPTATVNTPAVVPTNQARRIVLQAQNLSVTYGTNLALRDVTMDVSRHEITALIGPSGCGKSTLIRSFNRMNDLIPGAKVSGSALYEGVDLYGNDVDPVEVRRRIGMVFQKPNPFPKSIFDNVAFGLKVNGLKDDLSDRVEDALKRAALWDEVKKKLNVSALALSGGQQQRLCIARTIAVEPDIVLMDEPCSALDPIATARIEDLMRELKATYTIVIVTHNMQQAARVSDYAAFLTTEVSDEDDRTGALVEMGPTNEIFTTPKDSRTESYITGRFG